MQRVNKGYHDLARRLTAAGRQISHAGLIKAHRAGRITPEPDGTWDVAKVRAQLERNGSSVNAESLASRRRNLAAAAGHASVVKGEVAKPETPKVIPTMPPGAQVDDAPKADSQAEANRRKAWLDVELREIERRVRLGQLVERDEARKVLLGAGKILAAARLATIGRLKVDLIGLTNPNEIAERIETVLSEADAAACATIEKQYGALLGDK